MTPPAIPLSFAELRRLANQLAARHLKPRDSAVFLAVLVYMSPKSFQTAVSCALLAEQLGMQRPHVVASVSRLVASGVLVRHYHRSSGKAILSLPEDLVTHEQRHEAMATDERDEILDLITERFGKPYAMSLEKRVEDAVGA